MRIKITISFLTLFLGLSSLAIAENSGYLVSDTPITVNYIICDPSQPECKKDKLEPPVMLNATQKVYEVKNIPARGIAKIISLTINQRSYFYADDNNSLPCALSNNMAIKFEVYNNIIICNNQPVAVAK